MNKHRLCSRGYARNKNSVGCSIVTTGPGGTNSVLAYPVVG